MDSSAPKLRPATIRPVVLQVLPALGGGGVERGTVEMVQAIVEAGGTALVASAGGRLETAVEKAGGRNIKLKLASKNPLRMWWNVKALEDVIRREKVQIVHARSRAPGWSAWLAARHTGVHFVTTFHGAYGEGFPYKRHYNSVMANGERVIAISRFIAGLILQRYDIDPARIRLVPRGVDTTVFDPDKVTPERIQKLAEQWDLPEGKPLVMLPGRLTGWKGQAILIDAMAKLTRRDAVAVLVGAAQGRNRYASRLKRRAKSLGVDVRLVGDCTDMPAALSLADVVVSASVRPEAFGRVVIEAQAMARPVIASDHGGAAETVEHGATGWLVPPGDVEKLAAAIDHVLAMPPDRVASLGARSRAAVLAQYTVSRMQDSTLDVYREVLGLIPGPDPALRGV